MNEIVESARDAREKLAQALALLQSPAAVAIIDTVASPVARAMGALHSIESSQGGTLEAAGPRALGYVREALAALQEAPPMTEVYEAMAFVAGSLGLVHGLAEKAALHQAETTKAPDVGPVNLARTALSAQAPEGLQNAAAAKSPEPTQAATAPGSPIAIKKAEPAVSRSEETVELAAPRVASLAPDAFGKTALGTQSPVADIDFAPAPPVLERSVHSPLQDSKKAPAPAAEPPANALVVEANLGAHSATNFYKGLSGNDVIDDGGIFVATYKIPPIGAALWLKITMPGGYEFEASAEVRWTRDSHSGDTPGFGAAVRAVSPEARQLIYRYVRNREPLFYDDL